MLRTAGEEPRREALEPAEHAQPHLEQNFRRDARVHEATHHVERKAAERQAGEGGDDADQGPRVGANERPVDQQAREVRDVEREHCPDQRQPAVAEGQGAMLVSLDIVGSPPGRFIA